MHGWRWQMSGWIAMALVVAGLALLGVAAALFGVDSLDGCDYDWW